MLGHHVVRVNCIAYTNGILRRTVLESLALGLKPGEPVFAGDLGPAV